MNRKTPPSITKWLYCSALLLFISASSFAMTGDSLNYLTKTDTVFLERSLYGTKVFVHTLEDKQTLYSLAKFYGISVEDLYHYNPKLRQRAVAPYERVRVPIPNRAIKRYQKEDFVAAEHVLVYYVVSKGDNLFRIAKEHFRMPMEELMARNELESTTLHIGQQLHVGWISLEGITEEEEGYIMSPLLQANYGLRNQYVAFGSSKKEYLQRGLALQLGNGKMRKGFVALHAHAPMHSIISITNPMTRRTVYAKVIGRIPYAVHFDDVEAVVVVTPTLAKILGVIDPRFFAQVKYYRR